MRQPLAFVVVLVCPAGQVVHWRSATAVPVVLTKLPGEQFVQTAQVAALAVVLKVPLAHAAHVRLLVAVPFAVRDCPDTQLVHGTQAVAGLLS